MKWSERDAKASMQVAYMMVQLDPRDFAAHLHGKTFAVESEYHPAQKRVTLHYYVYNTDSRGYIIPSSNPTLFGRKYRWADDYCECYIEPDHLNRQLVEFTEL